MSDLPVRLVEFSVAWLAVLTLGIAFAVYLIMAIRHRRLLARGTRRLMLSNKLIPYVNDETFLAVWAKSSRRDREIIAEILLDQIRAVWAKSSRGDHEIIAEILLAQIRSQGAMEKRTVERLLGAMGAIQGWIRELRQGREDRRIRAAISLGYFRLEAGIQALSIAAEDRSPSVQLAVTLSLGRLRDPRGLPALIRVARQPPREIPDITLAAALAACSEGHVDRLVELLRSPNVRSRMIGGWALSQVADSRVLPQLVEAASDPEPEVRAKVARALARIPDPQSLKTLERLARDSAWFVRVRALDALGRLRATSSESVVFLGLEDKVLEVRNRAASALRQIRGMSGDVIAKVLATGSRRSFTTLISEWDRAGFLRSVVEGLSPRDLTRFAETQETLRALIRAGVTRVLANFILVFPDIKVRLRLLRLYREAAPPSAQAELLALASHPGCDRRVAAKIRGAVPSAATL